MIIIRYFGRMPTLGEVFHSVQTEVYRLLIELSRDFIIHWAAERPLANLLDCPFQSCEELVVRGRGSNLRHLSEIKESFMLFTIGLVRRKEVHRSTGYK